MRYAYMKTFSKIWLKVTAAERQAENSGRNVLSGELIKNQ
jgi:hypothetical protein